jgi:bis(5'-nucleosidyl)-tetraphosphatase
MSLIYEHSAGVIPFHRDGDRPLLYLVIHSATVHNPHARWEFPKGGIETGEAPREAAMREFEEETGIVSWAFCGGFERSLSYTFLRHGRKHFKTVVYFVGEVFDTSTMARSHEHMEDRFGRWCRWGSFEQISRLLCHAKIRRLFAEAAAWINDGDAGCHALQDRYSTLWGDPDAIPVMGLPRELSHPSART